jgi:hypothetical protein
MDACSLPCLQKLGSPQSHRGRREEDLFFVYQEMPASRQAGIRIAENNLSNETHDRGILQRSNPEDRGVVRAFVSDSSTCRGGGTEAVFSAISWSEKRPATRSLKIRK